MDLEPTFFDDEAHEQKYRQQVHDLTAAYLSEINVVEEKPVAIEKRFEVPLIDPSTGEDLGIPLVGIVDLVQVWHASTGDKTFTGPYGLMLAEGIHRMIDEMNELHGIDEEFETGLRAFDSQTREQKAWSLHKITFGLLDEATPMPELTAYLEATVAAVFGMIDACIQMELDDGDFFWRLVQAVYGAVDGSHCRLKFWPC